VNPVMPGASRFACPSVPGTYLAWTMMAVEVLFVAAKDKDTPSPSGESRNA
jgi:arginine:ornithine antiporter/lysine permease